jgi:ATP-dependent protease ClpP protease subunit
MSIRDLPQASLPAKPQNFHWDAPSDVLAKWAERPLAADGDAEHTISIYDVIGEDWWSGGGFTAARMAGALRKIGANPVTVNVNSPGGDLFDGIAMYNMLAAHPGKVTVNVMGMAASAASVIAMAGDEINMGLGSFIMVHNSWGMVIGNRHEMSQAATLFETFDSAIMDVYEARTGAARSEIEALMDAETFLAPARAIELGFADQQADSLQAKAASGSDVDKGLMARRRTEAALAKAGYSRGDRTQMIAALGGPRDATSNPAATRDAGDIEAGLRALISTIQ